MKKIIKSIILACVLIAGCSVTKPTTATIASIKHETVAAPIAKPTPWIVAGPKLNVKTDCGAQGNGSLKDGAAITKCLSKLPPTGGNILIPNGTYVISNPLILGNTSNTIQRINLYGAGPLAHLILQANRPANTHLITTPSWSTSEVYLHDIDLNCNAQHEPAPTARFGSCASLSGAKTYVWNTTGRNFSGEAFFAHYAANATVQNYQNVRLHNLYNRGPIWTNADNFIGTDRSGTYAIFLSAANNYITNLTVDSGGGVGSQSYGVVDGAPVFIDYSGIQMKGVGTCIAVGGYNHIAHLVNVSGRITNALCDMTNAPIGTGDNLNLDGGIEAGGDNDHENINVSIFNPQIIGCAGANRACISLLDESGTSVQGGSINCVKPSGNVGIFAGSAGQMTLQPTSVKNCSSGILVNDIAHRNIDPSTIDICPCHISFSNNSNNILGWPK